MLRYFVILLSLVYFSACVPDAPTTDPDTDPTTDSTNTDNPNPKPKPKPKTAVPEKSELMKSSSYYRQDIITPAKASQIQMEFVSRENETVEISLKMLKDKSFQLHLLVLAEDFPLILTGGYDIEGSDYILQFTDSELAMRIFGEEYNATTNIKMLSASEVTFPTTATAIDIWGISCDKK